MKRANKSLLKILLPTVTCFFLLVGCVENTNKAEIPIRLNEKILIELKGKWKFSLGDSPERSKVDFNDDNWELIDVPSSWENQGFHGYDGFAWYRKEFTVTDDLSFENLYLILGFVDDVDETYLNGKLIGLSGGFPPNYNTAYNAYRRYKIPSGLLRKEKNVIAVRVYDKELEGGIIGGEPGIYAVLNELNPDLTLEGIWKFKIGDDKVRADKNYDDSDWDSLFVPAHWEMQGYRDYDGFAWYRKKFSISKELSKERLVLLMGKIDDIDQTYINGVQIGSTGLWNFNKVPTDFNTGNEWEQKRIYSIPDGLLNFNDENIIAVRVYDGFRDGGIYQGPIGIITEKKFRQSSSR
ncbi:Glycoside hydrolase family protein [Ignavibacterium album JCM 16511]|uniref:Glycoside hydrolase family protein n=1 Tax=Ignavibacterium album (strain DSM 19864 / JCM 16511 / NBRC 101810 / Mat9-16) TaxID=945713 RepID=I0AN38_IGNAJ|nr:beta galactosidase jelly roll domain-containing protein [Ignavibacterium album]AFH50395.1 Glycoside hydrolase family protein [Ignavibacterium album JCM 16511]